MREEGIGSIKLLQASAVVPYDSTAHPVASVGLKLQGNLGSGRKVRESAMFANAVLKKMPSREASIADRKELDSAPQCICLGCAQPRPKGDP